MMAVARVSPARAVAFKILLGVERGEAHSDDLLRAKAVNALSAPDRNLATALVLGVLRWQLRLDQQLRPLLKRPGAKLDAEILIALRLGAFQLLHLDRIPAHAAIDESVELARQAGHRFASGMVNAVLRKVARNSAAEQHTSGPEGPGHLVSADAGAEAPAYPPASPSACPSACPSASPAAYSSICLNQEDVRAHPDWMVERWERIYGSDATCAICARGQRQPPLALRIEDARAATELVAGGIQLAPGELLTAARTVVAGDVTATAAFGEGRVRIQDEGSQLVGEIAAAVLATSAGGEPLLTRDSGLPTLAPEANREDGAREPGAPGRVSQILDACAAPGGKALILAERFPEARIVACEASPQRLAAMRERLSAYAGRIECRLADAAALGEDAAFDLALADVPCSGTGTLGRNPEIRHRLRIEDLPRQAERQRAILHAALRAVRPGGRVVYSTCSLEPEENEQVVAAVLAENANTRQISVLACLEELRRINILTGAGAERLAACITPEGVLRLLPGAFGTDGFFVAVLERVA
jgi:16S rRNA (cytosine967-C5)-methyltransferase